MEGKARSKIETRDSTCPLQVKLSLLIYYYNRILLLSVSGNVAASCPGYILPDNNNTAFKGSHDSYTTRTRYTTRLIHDTSPKHGRFQNLRQSDSWRSNDITTSRLHKLPQPVSTFFLHL